MDLSIILMIIGLAIICLSFFIKDSTKKLEHDVEELSITVFQETNNLKRRIKIVEEELLLEPDFQVKSPKSQNQKVQQVMQAVQQSVANAQPSESITKPIHQILVSQVIELNKQGLSIPEICVRSSLTEAQVKQVLATNGGR